MKLNESLYKQKQAVNVQKKYVLLSTARKRQKHPGIPRDVPRPYLGFLWNLFFATDNSSKLCFWIVSGRARIYDNSTNMKSNLIPRWN